MRIDFFPKLAGFMLSFCLAGALASAAPAQTVQDNLAQELQTYVDSFARTGFFSGVVIVERGGEPIILTASGVADRNFNVPVTPDTKFHIASLSKPITAAAIGRLVDQGKLEFETAIGTIVPGIPNGDRITIEQLLTHYSGLGSPDRAPDANLWAALPHTTEQLIDRIRAEPPMFEPGEKYEYSNANYWLLASVIEKLSGLSYGEFLEREIFLPLGMNDTAHRGDLLRVVPGLARGYQLDGASAYREGDLLDWTTKTGNGSIYSTARDLVKFQRGLTRGGLLSPETTDRIMGKGKRWGLPWFHRSAETTGRDSFFYNGRSPGFGSYLEGFFGEDTSFVILSNLYTYAPTAMADGIKAILWDLPYELAEPIALHPLSTEQLEAFEAEYQFGPEFHVRNVKARIVADGDHLKMHWGAGGRITNLLPIGPSRFFDPTFWATVDFVTVGGQKEIRYRSLGFTRIYEGKPVAS